MFCISIQKPISIIYVSEEKKNPDINGEIAQKCITRSRIIKRRIASLTKCVIMRNNAVTPPPPQKQKHKRPNL